MNTFTSIENRLKKSKVVGGENGIALEFDEGKSPNLIIVTGENATGKSLVRRLIHIWGKETQVEVIPLSQELRAGGMMGAMRAFVFGSEQDESTGYITVRAALTSLRTSRSRDTPHALLFDEPEIGLSDSYATGLADKIKEFLVKPPEHLKALVIISHRKTFVNRLIDLHPHHIRVGGAPPLKEWLERTEEAKDPEILQEDGHAMWLKINKLLKEK